MNDQWVDKKKMKKSTSCKKDWSAIHNEEKSL
jgi:hypothetical protein